MDFKINNEFPGIPGDTNQYWAQVSIQAGSVALGMFLQQDRNKLQMFMVGLDKSGKKDDKSITNIITMTVEQFAEAWLSMIEDGRKKGLIK